MASTIWALSTKKQIRKNTYRRYRLAFGNLGATLIEVSALLSFTAGGAIGIEKRRPVNVKLHFVCGTELIASLGFAYSHTGSATVTTNNSFSLTYTGADLTLVTPSIGVGFVVGLGTASTPAGMPVQNGSISDG